ncbi:hypothetical protein SAMN02745883_02274 [Caminicella sporogenes DSM 14501]|uniref:Uncharacterized protein n=1 Tax=Caminicella sporogenes DSM 14501 TaxID=1121266 RepID=A0A1M6T967_9FIRM|nr:hypothetical protein [Caminicella sporogenes]RKD26070.1 hypothetical protein BET04_10990 [Caminicella sporogenes]WIF94323.1 hypothetical protein QNI18_08610 [Caminicella sporogenes]SHK53298.1 hypothetical protein SAMN02745883_02274 [Caminicella sporogenes DSM 14501]
MDIKKISNKIVSTASDVSRQADYLVSISEYKMDIKHLNKEIEKLELLIGKYIYNWFFNKSFAIKDVPRLCREIREKERELKKIEGKVAQLKKNFNSK